jgi:Glucodextranase, domain B
VSADALALPTRGFGVRGAALKRTLRTLAVAALLVSSAAIGLPAGAADRPWTSITTPKAAGQSIHQFYDLLGPAPALFVSGTAHNTIQVDIYCFYDHDTLIHTSGSSGPTPLNGNTPVPIQPDGTFSTSIEAPDGEPCTLRAIPSSVVLSFVQLNVQTYQTFAYVGSFTGPRFYVGGHEVVENTSSTPINAAELAAQPRAVVVYTAQDAGGAFALYPVEDFAGWISKTIGQDMLGVRPTNATVGNGLADRSEVVVDGNNAYLPSTLDTLVADHSTVPPLSAQMTRSATTGELSMTATAPLRWCAGYPATNPCAPQPTGVSWVRTARSSLNGALTIVHDTFKSTDGRRHTVALELRTGLRPDGVIGIRRPGQSTFSTPADGTTVNAMPTGAHTVFATNDLHGTDGTPNHVVWGLTYSAKPQFFYAGDDFANDGVYVFAYRYTLTVPAGGSVKRAFAASTAFSSATASAVSTTAQKAFTTHLSITAPRSGTSTADNTPTIRGRITNAVNGLPSKVTVTIGTRSRSVSVSSNGSFSVTWVHLANGKHTVVAKCTDPSGIALSGRSSFRVT